MCPMNCAPTLCGMNVTVEDGRLTQVKGDKGNPDSKGFLCVRGQAAHEIIDNPKRILQPMVRDQRGSSDWREVSWEEAIERIAGNIKSVNHDNVGMWIGHGELANDYGVFANAQLGMRLAMMYGLQVWDGSMICWGLGGFGLGLTGMMEVNSKEDLGENSDLVILWGANIASQPNTSSHIAAARARGARVVVIDIRRSEACKLADEVILVKPGTDAALALAMMNIIIENGGQDDEFIAEHTLGYDKLREHAASFTAESVAAICGVSAEDIRRLAMEYADTARAMIIIGGSSLYKDGRGWEASRAISCLPGLTGKSGKPGTGLGPRHAGNAHGFALNHIVDPGMMPPGNYIPNQMSAILRGLEEGQLKQMLLLGTNMLSSYADSNRVASGLEKTDMVVVHDLFMNETAERFADIFLPATCWLEDIGCKATASTLVLMDRVLEPAGNCRSLAQVTRMLADALEVENFYPWEHEAGHIDAVLDHPCTGHITVEKLRQQGGLLQLDVSPVAHVTHQYTTPSGKIEFYSTTAEKAGLSALPDYSEAPVDEYPLQLRFGRTLDHFHSFYNHGAALPSMAKLEEAPLLWLSSEDAQRRNINSGDEIRVHNGRGTCDARAHVSDDYPAPYGCMTVNLRSTALPRETRLYRNLQLIFFRSA